jgi:hypothetical protein
MSETKGVCPDRPRGAKPIRKRGYHRALKRGESWAVIKREMNAMWMNDALQYAMTPSPFIKMIGIKDIEDTWASVIGVKRDVE